MARLTHGPRSSAIGERRGRPAGPAHERRRERTKGKLRLAGLRRRREEVGRYGRRRKSGPNDMEGRGDENKFLFTFLNTIFKSKFNSNLNPFEVLIKPNHYKINMQLHVCTNMLLPCDEF